MPTLFVELLHSYVQFFASDPSSELIATKKYGIDMSLITEFRDQYSPVRTQLQLHDFPIYGARLDQIRHKMNQWRPTGVRDLMVRPYNDPLSFYAFWFGTLLGSIGVLSLALTVAQTYAAFVQINQGGQGSGS
jgi:hypothetical protein